MSIWQKKNWDELTSQEKVKRSIVSFLIVGTIAILILIVSQMPDPPASDATSTSPPAKPAPTQPVKADADHKQQYLDRYAKVLDVAKPCDEANGRVGKAVTAAGNGTSTVYEAYGIATEATDACSATISALFEIEAPDTGPDNAQATFQKGLDKCRESFGARKAALETLKTAIDGDMRPSVLNEFKEQSEFATGGLMLCVGNMMMAATEAGVTQPEMDKFLASLEKGK